VAGDTGGEGILGNQGFEDVVDPGSPKLGNVDQWLEEKRGRDTLKREGASVGTNKGVRGEVATILNHRRLPRIGRGTERICTKEEKKKGGRTDNHTQYWGGQDWGQDTEKGLGQALSAGKRGLEVTSSLAISKWDDNSNGFDQKRKKSRPG